MHATIDKTLPYEQEKREVLYEVVCAAKATRRNSTEFVISVQKLPRWPVIDQQNWGLTISTKFLTQKSRYFRPTFFGFHSILSMITKFCGEMVAHRRDHNFEPAVVLCLFHLRSKTLRKTFFLSNIDGF